MKRSLPDSPAHDQESETAGLGQAGVLSNEQERRKKRRGMTEKRRRDRINDLLSQLQELIPSVSERKEVGKLEKAEVLEMAVMHMRNKLLASKAKPEVRTTQGTCTWTSPSPVGPEDCDWKRVYDEFRQPSFIPIHAPLGFGQTLVPSIPPMSRPNTVDEVLGRGVEPTCHVGCYCNSHALL